VGGSFVSRNMKPKNPNFGPVYRERPHPSGHSQSLTGKELLARARAGDQAAFGELCKRSEPRLLRMARHIVRNEEDAQDAVQEALLNAFRNLSTFDERSSFFTWATRIAINSSLIQPEKAAPILLDVYRLRSGRPSCIGYISRPRSVARGERRTKTPARSDSVLAAETQSRCRT